MSLLFSDSFTWLTIAIYLLASGLGASGMICHNRNLRGAGAWLALGAFVCQTMSLLLGFHGSPSGLSMGAFLQLLAWFVLLCGLLAWWRLKHESLLLMAAPLGLILYLMSAASLRVSVNLPKQLGGAFFTLHIGALFLCLGLLSLAFAAGICFLVLSKRLKIKKNMKGRLPDLPALSILDKINAACAIGAFILYSLGLLAGLFWSVPIYGSMLSGDPKEIASIFIWLLLAILFHNRLALGWKGRKPALLAIFAFVLSILSLFLVNFMLPSHHSFIHI